MRRYRKFLAGTMLAGLMATSVLAGGRGHPGTNKDPEDSEGSGGHFGHGGCASLDYSGKRHKSGGIHLWYGRQI